MKKTKVIIPALGLLVLSTAASVTGTVAWFSMNTTVDANNMVVSVNSNSTYLLVSNAVTDPSATAPTAAEIQAENTGAGFTSITFSAEALSVYPVAPAATFTAASGNTPASHTEYVAGANVAAPSYWYTMAGTNATAQGYTGVAGTETNVTNSLSSYVLTYKLYFTIAVGAVNAANLRVDSVTFAAPNNGTADAALCCLVVGTGGSVLYNQSSDTDSLILETSLDSAHVYSVQVFIYYDGNASTIYTNNMENILNGIVNVRFAVGA